MEWGAPPLPEWVEEFRPHQLDAVYEIAEEYARGTDVILLDAPTGSGKSLLGEAVRRMQGKKALYICSSLTLQDQFMGSFPYARLLKGRRHYPTLDHPEAFGKRFESVTAADCTSEITSIPVPDCDGCSVYDEFNVHEATHCRWCHGADGVMQCPYNMAKTDALSSDLAVLNTAYFLSEANGPGAFSKQHLVIADEADLMENELMSHIEVRISERRRRELDLDVPEKKTVATAWVEWFAQEAIPKVAQARSRIRGKEIADVRDRKALTILLQRLVRVAEELGDGTDPNWIYTGYESGHRDPEIVFRPVRVASNGPGMLWRHGGRWLMMSATIIDPDGMMADLGLPDEMSYSLVKVPMTFPAMNRPVKYLSGSPDMGMKNREAAWPIQAELVGRIMDAHSGERILVHTVSYAFAQYLFDHLPRRRLVIYGGADDRGLALKQYVDQPDAVLLAPSMQRGVDLPDDLCRVSVITKIPFPSLGDKQVSARLYSAGGNNWYATQTVRGLLQSAGRGVRHKDDRCITYVTDKAYLNNVWKKSRHLLPKWWQEAMDWSGEIGWPR